MYWIFFLYIIHHTYTHTLYQSTTRFIIWCQLFHRVGWVLFQISILLIVASLCYLFCEVQDLEINFHHLCLCLPFSTFLLSFKLDFQALLILSIHIITEVEKRKREIKLLMNKKVYKNLYIFRCEGPSSEECLVSPILLLYLNCA